MIAVLALIIATLTLIVSGITYFHTVRMAEKPTKLEAFRIAKEFATYCSKYRTDCSKKPVECTRDLWHEIDSFKWNLEKLGPTGIKEFSVKSKELQNKAKSLQRELERYVASLEEGDDNEAQKCEDSIDELTEWFHAQKNELKEYFAQYV